MSPPGLEFLEAVLAPGRAGQVEAVEYRLPLPDDRRESASEAVAALLLREQIPYLRHKPDRDVPLDLRPSVLDAGVDPLDGSLRLRLKFGQGGSARPEEVIDVLGLRDLMAEGAVLCRTEVEIASEHPIDP